jgi:hypothetical protein
LDLRNEGFVALLDSLGFGLLSGKTHDVLSVVGQ